jgi:CRISPR-associated protein Csb2
MPLGVLDRGREKTSLVFDTWADVSDGEMEIHWDCDLTVEESGLLTQLVASLGYLGRSESWVAGTVIDSPSVTTFNAVPHRDGERRGPEWDQVAVLGPMPPLEYAEWRGGEVARVLADFPLPEGKKKPPKKLLVERERAVAPFPPDLVDCLLKDTAWWKSHRWNAPPGSQSVLYWRRRGALEVGPPTQMQRAQPPKVTTMLLALSTPRRNASALPACTRTLPQAELFHRALVGRVGRGQRVDVPELTGRDDGGRPLTLPHQHAHVLPLDLDDDNHLDHLLIHAPMGLGPEAQAAIRALRRTWTKGSVGELQLALAGVGDLDSLRLIKGQSSNAIDALLGEPEGASVWISRTPFVPPRFLKQRGRNNLEGQVRSELESRGITTECTVELLMEESKRFRHYIRCRKRAKAPPQDLGLALRLRFARPVSGPISIGYAAHFGMGQFRTDD